MKGKLATVVVIVLLLGVGYAGCVWYRHATRDPYAPPAPDAPKAPGWSSSPEDEPETSKQDPPEDEPETSKQDPPDSDNGTAEQNPLDELPPDRTHGIPLDVAIEFPEVPTEIVGPSPPIEDEPEEC